MTHSGHEAESMTNNNWDGWLQISSTLAVLFGIALVEFELQQKSIDDPSNLTHLEYRALDAFVWSITINRWRSLYELAERRLLEEEVWQRAVREDGPALAYPFGRAYWAVA